jgi:hypothetical protein
MIPCPDEEGFHRSVHLSGLWSLPSPERKWRSQDKQHNQRVVFYNNSTTTSKRQHNNMRKKLPHQSAHQETYGNCNADNRQWSLANSLARL